MIYIHKFQKLFNIQIVTKAERDMDLTSDREQRG